MLQIYDKLDKEHDRHHRDLHQYNRVDADSPRYYWSARIPAHTIQYSIAYSIIVLEHQVVRRIVIMILVSTEFPLERRRRYLRSRSSPGYLEQRILK